eukprot:323508_1
MATSSNSVKQNKEDQDVKDIVEQLKTFGYQENSILAALEHVNNKKDINEIMQNIDANNNFNKPDEKQNDSLYVFLTAHQDRLKDSTMNIFQTLKKENMDLDEISEFAEADLRATLKEANMPAKSIGRLINVLRHYQPSIVYKESQRNLFVKRPPAKYVIPIQNNIKKDENNKSMASKPIVNLKKVNNFFEKVSQFQPASRKFEDLFYDIQVESLMPSVPERLNCLVMGYVSESLYDKYPIDLNRLIIHFLGNIIFVFDLVHEKYINCIQHEGTYIRRPGQYEQYTLHDWVYVTIGSSLAFNDSFNEFSIKCIKPRSDAIGILSNTAICKDKQWENIWCQKGPGNMYYYYGGGAISSGLNTKDKPPKQKKIEKWQKGDIITVKVDRKEWTVRWLKNEKLIGRKVKIMPNVDYYPFVGTQYHDTDYELIY